MTLNYDNVLFTSVKTRPNFDALYHGKGFQPPLLTCEDIDDFSDIKFTSYIVLKFVGVSSKHLRVFLESLQQSSAIFGHLREFSEILGKCSGTRGGWKPFP